MCSVSGTGGVEPSADGPNWGRSKKFLGTVSMQDAADADMERMMLPRCLHPAAIPSTRGWRYGCSEHLTASRCSGYDPITSSPPYQLAVPASPSVTAADRTG